MSLVYDPAAHPESVSVGFIGRENWTCEIAPHFKFHTMRAPNWFWRKMQRLVFGFRWERVKP